MMCTYISGILFFLIRISFVGCYLIDADLCTSDFASIAETPLFVDKTDLIKTFFESDECGLLITTIRRCGKSTNLDMLKSYCEVCVFNNGSKIPTHLTENFKVFSNMYNKTGQMEFLNIYKNVNSSKLFNNTFGKYPVIHLDFKKLSVLSFESFVSTFRSMVSWEFKRHSYLLKSKSLNETEKDCVNKYTYLKKVDKLHVNHLEVSISLLSKMLNSHFNKRVIVLIDEYDAPIQKAIFYSSKDIDKIIILIQNFITNSLKSNPAVERALINACIRQSGVYSYDANIRFHLFNQKHPFNEFYGFTENEVKRLTEKFSITTKMAEIRAWYDGYNVPDSNIKLYNVHSILSYLEYTRVDNYWVKSGSIYTFRKIFLDENIRVKVIKLLDNETCTIITSTDKITVKDIRILLSLVKQEKNGSIDLDKASLFLQLILDLGYLTCTKKQGNEVALKIPNKEIRDEFIKIMYSTLYYTTNFNLKDKDVQEYINSIDTLGTYNSSYEEFGKCLLNLFNRKITENEHILRGLLYDLPIFSNQFEIVSKEKGVTNKNGTINGFIDVLIIRRVNTGILFEIMYYNTVSHLKKKIPSSEPLKQVVRNRYYNIFKTHKVTNKILIGILAKQRDQETGKPQIIISYLYNSIKLKDCVTLTIN